MDEEAVKNKVLSLAEECDISDFAIQLRQWVIDNVINEKQNRQIIWDGFEYLMLNDKLSEDYEDEVLEIMSHMEGFCSSGNKI